jgi:hypothetical protein
LDSLLRQRLGENVKTSIDTALSITRLVDRIKGMPVGTSVRSDFEIVLKALKEVSGFWNRELECMSNKHVLLGEHGTLGV